MNSLQIKYFLSIVENGLNFTKASKALCVSQPAISKHINKLGEELGIKLFNTNKTTTRLTPGGELIYQFFTECGEKLTRIISEAKYLNSQNTGDLKVAAINGWDISLLNDIFGSFSTSYQNISISFEAVGFRAINNGLLANTYDLIFTLRDQLEGLQNVSIKDITTTSRILLYSTNHPLAKKEAVTVLDFKDDIFYTLSEDETPLAKIINEQYCKSKGFIPQFKMAPNIDTILLFLESGKGFTILDQKDRRINNTAFKYIELDDFLRICVAWKKNNTNWALKAFLDTCF
jgi:DNA-binding transcriptional LysR family regulator